MICVRSVLVAASACVMLVWKEACVTPPLKLVAMLLISCSQLPIALQTLFAYASLAFVSEAAAATGPHQGQNSDQRQDRCCGDPSSGMTTTTSTSPIKHRETSLESFEPSKLPFAFLLGNREHELRHRRTPRTTRARYEVASATLGRTRVVAHHADRMIRSDGPNATLLDEPFQRPVVGRSAFEKEENDGICHQRTGRSLHRDLP